MGRTGIMMYNANPSVHMYMFRVSGPSEFGIPITMAQLKIGNLNSQLTNTGSSMAKSRPTVYYGISKCLVLLERVEVSSSYEHRTLDPGRWTLDAGRWTPDAARWTLHYTRLQIDLHCTLHYVVCRRFLPVASLRCANIRDRDTTGQYTLDSYQVFLYQSLHGLRVGREA